MNVFKLILVLCVVQCYSQTEEASDLRSYNMKSGETKQTTCDDFCIRKCCEINYFANKAHCIEQSIEQVQNLSIPLFSKKTHVYNFTLDSSRAIIGHVGCESYVVDPRNRSHYRFYVQEEGSLLLENSGMFSVDEYCVEFDGDGELIAYVCFPKEFSTAKTVCMIISLPFLVATFTVYACLSDRNVHGNCLMCYVASLAVAYIFLVTILLYPTHLENVSCNVLAYICYIAFLASFFWMNAMCLDLFWAFSGKRGYGGDNKSQLKRFAFFNVYAWGIPFLLLIIVIILNGTMDQNSPIYPGIADKKCWFADGLPVFLYFYLIIAIILVINLGCFILTALQIRKVRQDTAMLHRTDSQRHSYDNDRHKFDLYLKLLLAMGINWTMEVISWAVEWQLGSNVPEELFYATDFCNACYGVIIFIIFVCNKEKRRRLRKWYYSITGRPMRAQSMSNSSQTTRITHAAAERTTTNDSALLRDPK